MIDPELYNLLQSEEVRQAETLNLIASENFAPKEIRELGASVLANKYTEGYPGKRYYAGCGVFDEIESLGEQRACQLFGAAWANLQPHSGASANNAVFQAILRPGDPLLGLALDHGGHLSHGMKLNVSGSLYRAHAYHLRGTEIDMDEVAAMAQRVTPKIIIAGWSAYTDTMDFKSFREIANSVGAVLLVDMSHFSGLVAGGAYPDPMPWADIVTTTTHKTLRGPRGGIIMGGREEWRTEIQRAVFPGQQGGALPQTMAAKALALYLASQPEWKNYAQSMIENARALAESLREQGRRVICAGKTHQLLLDLEGESGLWGQNTLEENGIVCNRNTIPGDTRSPGDPSGLRLGSPALTTRGMGPEEFAAIGSLVDKALSGKNVQQEVRALLQRFPVTH